MGRNFIIMTKIPSDDILEGLHKLRIRESDKLKTVLELYKMEIHQEKVGPDYHRIEDNGEEKYRAESTLQGLPQRNLHQFIL